MRAGVLALVLLVAPMTYAKGHGGGRASYGGGSHSGSHGGSYAHSQGGSSHKGGSYRNAATGNHYGRHK